MQAVLQNYLQTLIKLPVKNNDEVIAFFTSDIMREMNQPVMQAGHKEGYLTKRGKNFGGWKTRYFVLQGPVLEYYDCVCGSSSYCLRFQINFCSAVELIWAQSQLQEPRLVDSSGRNDLRLRTKKKNTGMRFSLSKPKRGKGETIHDTSCAQKVMPTVTVGSRCWCGTFLGLTAKKRYLTPRAPRVRDRIQTAHRR